MYRTHSPIYVIHSSASNGFYRCSEAKPRTHLPATKLTQHKERGPVTCVRTAVTYFERCSNVARLTSHKRLATTLDCT